MNYAVQCHAAWMRCQNLEWRRRRLWSNIERKLTTGKFTEKEAGQLKREFWEQARRDQQIALNR